MWKPCRSCGSDRSTILLGQAREYYLAENYDEAIIFLFSYELVELDRRSLIRLAVGKTNRQYLRELGARTALASLLGQTMVAFEDVYFGTTANSTASGLKTAGIG